MRGALEGDFDHAEMPILQTPTMMVALPFGVVLSLSDGIGFSASLSKHSCSKCPDSILV